MFDFVMKEVRLELEQKSRLSKCQKEQPFKIHMKNNPSTSLKEGSKSRRVNLIKE